MKKFLLYIILVCVAFTLIETKNIRKKNFEDKIEILFIGTTPKTTKVVKDSRENIF